MGKAIKWILAFFGLLVALIVIAVIVLPRVIDVNKYKPLIEQQVTKATGRSFTLGGKIEPSFFPWVGVRLSDLQLGNPPGFTEKDLVSIKSFDVRVKLLPLLSRDIEVKRFVVNEPVIVLEKRKDGQSGWEGIGKKTSTAAAPAEPESQSSAESGGLPIKGLTVGEFAIKDGRILWLDEMSGTRQEVKDLNLVLSNVSLDHPINVAFSAQADGKPVSLDGTLGPLGPQPGKQPLPLDLALKLLDTLEVKLSGRVDPSVSPATFDLNVGVGEFSPRDVMARLGQKLPIEPADAKALTAVALSLKVKGSPAAVAVSDGELKLDDSRLTFSARASEFDKPNLSADLRLDQIDLDRYLPAGGSGEAGGEKAASAAPESAKKPTDYAPLRRLVLDAQFAAGAVTVKKAHLQDIAVKVTARNGIIRVDPLKLNMYQGHLAGNTTLNVQKNQPATHLKLALGGVQAGPLIKDVMGKDLLEGTMTADVGLNFTGDAPETIRRTLGGEGSLRFNDGAILGIDLAGMVRNATAAFGLGQETTEKPRTDFAELAVPFTITNGLFKTDATRMVSPLLRVEASGNANLVKESLDFRVEPKFVATLKGQGDTSQRSGIMVPVVVSGTFSDPSFTPDLAAILNQSLPDKETLRNLTEEKAKEELQKLVKPGENQDKAIQEGIKGLLKGLGN